MSDRPLFEAMSSEIISSEPTLNLSAPLLNLQVILRSSPPSSSPKSPVQSYPPILVSRLCFGSRGPLQGFISQGPNEVGTIVRS